MLIYCGHRASLHKKEKTISARLKAGIDMNRNPRTFVCPLRTERSEEFPRRRKRRRDARIYGKKGARNHDHYTRDIYSRPPTSSSYSERKGRKGRKGNERKDACWALPPKHLPSPGRFSCSNDARHNEFDLLKLYASLEREPSLSAWVSPSSCPK